MDIRHRKRSGEVVGLLQLFRLVQLWVVLVEGLIEFISDIKLIHFAPLWNTLPTQFALYGAFYLSALLTSDGRRPRLFFQHSTPSFECSGTMFAVIPFYGYNLSLRLTAISLDEDADTNKELVAHGYSNLLAGLFGTV